MSNVTGQVLHNLGGGYIPFRADQEVKASGTNKEQVTWSQIYGSGDSSILDTQPQP